MQICIAHMQEHPGGRVRNGGQGSGRRSCSAEADRSFPQYDLARTTREGGHAMAVLVRRTPVGMDMATYDQISPPLIESLLKQPGFVMHCAFAIRDGIMVGEIWESADEESKWFEETVRPNLPPGAEVQREAIELHNLVVRQ